MLAVNSFIWSQVAITAQLSGILFNPMQIDDKVEAKASIEILKEIQMKQEDMDLKLNRIMSFLRKKNVTVKSEISCDPENLSDPKFITISIY